MVKNRVKKKQLSQPQNLIENINIDIDYDKLAKAIAIAQDQVKEDNVEKQKEQREEHLRKWHETVKYKECPANSNKLKKFLCCFRNAICGVWAVVMLKRENVKNDTVTFSLLLTMTSGLFTIVKWSLYIIALFIMCVVFKYHKPSLLIAGIVILFLARIFRVVSFEIDNMKDRNYVIAIFSAITSFSALIIAVIAFFKG